MSSRQCANIWWYLFKREHFRSNLRYIFKSPKRFYRDVLKSPHFWHDSFTQYWYRWYKCKHSGHNKVQLVDEHCGEGRLHCFDCQQDVVLAPCRVCGSKKSQIFNKISDGLCEIYCNSCGIGEAELYGSSWNHVVRKWNSK